MTDTPPLLFVAKLGALRPANEEAEEAVKACKGTVRVEIRQATPNARRMALYWVVAGKVAENWPMADGRITKRALHIETKRALGLSKRIGLTTTGLEIWDDESISFARMTEPDRAEFIENAFALWGMKLGVDVETLREEGMAA